MKNTYRHTHTLLHTTHTHTHTHTHVHIYIILSANPSKRQPKYNLPKAAQAQVQFDDKATYPDNRKGNKFAGIDVFFQGVNVQNTKSRIPLPYTSIDETLYLYDGRKTINAIF